MVGMCQMEPTFSIRVTTPSVATPITYVQEHTTITWLTRWRVVEVDSASPEMVSASNVAIAQNGTRNAQLSPWQIRGLWPPFVHTPPSTK